MVCDIQQVRLNDLMVSSEYMNCWAACQKPDRLLVFPQVTIFIYPCPPELCGETPFCNISSRILMGLVNAKMESTAVCQEPLKCCMMETQLRLNRSQIPLNYEVHSQPSRDQYPWFLHFGCQFLAALWHGAAGCFVLRSAMLSRAPLHRLEGPLLTMMLGTEQFLHHKLQFQVVTQLIPESLAVWVVFSCPPALAPVLLLVWIHSQMSQLQSEMYSLLLQPYRSCVSSPQGQTHAKAGTRKTAEIYGCDGEIGRGLPVLQKGH